MSTNSSWHKCSKERPQDNKPYLVAILTPPFNEPYIAIAKYNPTTHQWSQDRTTIPTTFPENEVIAWREIPPYPTRAPKMKGSKK